MEDDKLLAQYAHDGSEAAFGQLVARHLTLVYSTCLRENGSPTQAEDAAQVVFLLLARKAKSLHAGPSLAGWLYKAARFVAKDVRKREARRQRGEERVMQEEMHRQESPAPEWDRVEPLLNNALSALKPAEREAVLLRFIEGHSLAETGALLNLSEDAARMRVTRAVDRLRRFFANQGVTLSVAALTGLLADRTTQAAPVESAAHIMAGIADAGAGNLPIEPNIYLQLKGALHAMTTTKRYATIAAVLMIGSAGIVFNNFRHTSTQALGASRETPDLKSTSDPLSPNPAVRAAAQQRHIEQAMLLRDHWQPWAENHRDLLSQMLHAQPSDAEALARVYEAIPANPSRGSRPGAAGISHDDLHTPGALFTWNAMGKGPIRAPSDLALSEQLAKSNTWFNKRMREDFSKYHDFRLTESVSTGRYHTVLWVSGRVTVMVDRDRFVGHGKPIEDYQEVQAEVSPMYDFLKG